MEAIDLNSLERIVPREVDCTSLVQSESLRLHINRYEFAARHLSGERCLDIACGVGYGAHLLAEIHPSSEIVGVDISEQAIEYAKLNYVASNLEFIVQDAFEFEPSIQFDSIVSLETIEHLSNPELFLKHLKKLMKPRGILIASVPITPSTDGNPHHLHDFSARTFRSLLMNSGFEEFECFLQSQPFRFRGLKGEARLQNMRKNMGLFYLKNPLILARRIRSLVLDGLQNRYLTVAARAA